MDTELALTGIVLKDMPIGEYDKRISLLTLERGRISAFLRGAKRPKGSSFSSIGPFTFGKFFVYEGRNSVTVKRTEIRERFDGVKSNLTNVAYGSYFLDVAEYYSREAEDEEERLGLLFQSLRALSSDKFSKEFIRLIYELKNIAIEGEYPNVFSCGKCNSKEVRYFSFDKRTCFCEDCKGEPGQIRISDSAIYALWYIFSTDVKKLYSFKLSKEIYHELRSFADRYIRLYFNHSFKTFEMISLLAGDLEDGDESGY